MPDMTTMQQHWYGGNDGVARSKEAELANTHGMPAQGPPKPGAKKTLATVQKTGSIEELFSMTGSFPEHAERAKKAQVMSPHVDVSGSEAPAFLQEKKAQAYALPDQDRYPLDNYAQVQRAVGYFTGHSSLMKVADRRVYCRNLEKRASELGIETTHAIGKYASAQYAPDHEVELAFDARRTLLGEEHCAQLDKLASHREDTDPEVFCIALHEFDKHAGIQHTYDSQVPDPFWSLFGFQKEAKESTFIVGNDIITSDQLLNFSLGRAEYLVGHFGEAFEAKFRKEPIKTFNALPIDQKKVVIRMATDNSPK